MMRFVDEAKNSGDFVRGLSPHFVGRHFGHCYDTFTLFEVNIWIGV
jgi:hypothetical protein